MIEIDGSFQEGGGALLRVSAALSALTGKAFHMENIRVRRPKPGMMMQHFSAARAIANLSGAQVNGLKLGSTQITFIPGQLRGGKIKVDVQTAGSTSLILQALIIPALFAPETVEIEIKGGTDVQWAPSVDYLSHVTLPILRSMGASVKLELLNRGHYPRGGGLIRAITKPVGKLKPLTIHELKVDVIKGISHSTRLPRHVAIRQADSAQKTLRSAGFEVEIEVKSDDNGLSPGSGLVLWSEYKGKNIPRVGASSLGKPGKPAEIVGREAATEILSYLSRGAALDQYMGDQIIPYMAISGSSSVKISRLTNHTLTNIYAAEKFTDCHFHVEGSLGEVTLIEVE
ncbi:alanine acetyltransferase [Methanobacterium petrolearium]|nr:alanine acetyltransferase [Methanobacterium petrolearium]